MRRNNKSKLNNVRQLFQNIEIKIIHLFYKFINSDLFVNVIFWISYLLHKCYVAFIHLYSGADKKETSYSDRRF
jgi:hypothetical protein